MGGVGSRLLANGFANPEVVVVCLWGGKEEALIHTIFWYGGVNTLTTTDFRLLGLQQVACKVLEVEEWTLTAGRSLLQLPAQNAVVDLPDFLSSLMGCEGAFLMESQIRSVVAT